MIRSLLLIGATLASKASAACSRAFLQQATAAYIEAQTAGQPSKLSLGSNVSYTENDAPVSIEKGLLTQPIKIDLHRSLLDTTECAVFAEFTAATNSHPYVVDTRLRFTDDKVTDILTVVADTGDWLFNATGHLYWAKKELWDPIPEGKRDTRAVIKAAGDAYLDSWGNGSVKAPYGTPCARLEGGAYTGDKNANTNTCFMPEFPKPFAITNRRYVIDEELGGLGIFNDFPFIDAKKPNGTSSTNFFRVEGGKIRYIHETTICSTRNCGR